MKIKSIYLLISFLALLALAMNQAQASLNIALTINFSVSFTLKMKSQLRTKAGLLFYEWFANSFQSQVEILLFFLYPDELTVELAACHARGAAAHATVQHRVALVRVRLYEIFA